MEKTKIIKYESGEHKQEFLIKKPTVVKSIFLGKIFLSKLLPIIKGIENFSEIAEVETDNSLNMISELIKKIDFKSISVALDEISEGDLEKVFDIVLSNTFQKMPSDKGFETPIKENGYFPEPEQEFDFNLQIFFIKEFITFVFGDVLKKNQ